LSGAVGPAPPQPFRDPFKCASPERSRPSASPQEQGDAERLLRQHGHRQEVHQVQEEGGAERGHVAGDDDGMIVQP
jgi:hypothetical protein